MTEHKWCVCSLLWTSWRVNKEELRWKQSKIQRLAAEEQQPAGLRPRSPAAATLQPLLQTRSLPGSWDPQHLLLLDHILIDSCHTCHLSLGMMSHLRGLLQVTHWRHFRSRNGHLLVRVIDELVNVGPAWRWLQTLVCAGSLQKWGIAL